jgi:hypothetical protein
MRPADAGGEATNFRSSDRFGKLISVVFISYSHFDTKWLTDLLTMAAPFVKFGGMRTFELPRILKARQERGLELVWVLVSHCLYEATPLAPIQAAFPLKTPLEDMSEPKKKAALKAVCLKLPTH